MCSILTQYLFFVFLIQRPPTQFFKVLLASKNIHILYFSLPIKNLSLHFFYLSLTLLFWHFLFHLIDQFIVSQSFIKNNHFFNLNSQVQNTICLFLLVFPQGLNLIIKIYYPEILL